MLPVLIFKHRKIYDKNVLSSGCLETDALFELMGPRKHLEPKELIHIAKMGYSWKIVGDTPSFKRDCKEFCNE